jgi:hypothetical protein
LAKLDIHGQWGKEDEEEEDEEEEEEEEDEDEVGGEGGMSEGNRSYLHRVAPVVREAKHAKLLKWFAAPRRQKGKKQSFGDVARLVYFPPTRLTLARSCALAFQFSDSLFLKNSDLIASPSTYATNKCISMRL